MAFVVRPYIRETEQIFLGRVLILYFKLLFYIGIYDQTNIGMIIDPLVLGTK